MDFFKDLSDQLPPRKPGWEKVHAVIVEFMYYKEELDQLFDLDDKLEKAIRESGVGQYDYHEINMDMTDGRLFMYGPDAGELFKVVEPILEQTDFTRGALAVLRFGGGVDAKEIEIQIEK